MALKYNQAAIKNSDGKYIKYPTAYSHRMQFTDSLYDVHLWEDKKDAQKLADYLNKNEETGFIAVMV